MPNKNKDHDGSDSESEKSKNESGASGSEGEEEEYVVEKVVDKRIVKNGKVCYNLQVCYFFNKLLFQTLLQFISSSSGLD